MHATSQVREQVLVDVVSQGRKAVVFSQVREQVPVDVVTQGQKAEVFSKRAPTALCLLESKGFAYLSCLWEHVDSLPDAGSPSVQQCRLQ